MKKMMIAVMMLLGTSAVFAGDSDALKTILKAKTYAEAESLLKQNVGQLANASEKAAAYNKLVNLAMDKVNKEQSVINANQMAVQFKQGKEEAYDTLGFYNAVYDAINNGMLADTFDRQPNEKGKVKPKFESSNATSLYALRTHLINGGQEYGKKEDQAQALKFYGMYVDSSVDPLFNSIDKTKTPDLYLGEVARVAAVYSFQAKDLNKANKYCDIAMKDTSVYKDALNLKMYLMQQGLKTKADSLQYIETLKGIYAKDQNNEQIFATLANMYGNMKMTTEQNKFIEDKIVQDPKCFSAWALKGQNAMNANKLDEAISSFRKALEIDGNNVVVLTYIGFTMNAQAGAINGDVTAQKKLYQESATMLEKARNLDPNREKANWSYPLYQCYYSLYGANDARTKEMENLNK